MKLREANVPPEVLKSQKELRRHTANFERAQAERNYEQAKIYKKKEQDEIDKLASLREIYNLASAPIPTVTRDDIEEVISRWTGIPITSIKEEETE